MKESSQYVIVIRFHNDGFYTKPYNTDYINDRNNHFFYSLPFYNVEIKDLNSKNIIIDENDIIKPEINDEKWSGCFAFLNTYDKSLLEHGKALAMRKGHKKNIAFMKNTGQTVWIRNTTHWGHMSCYVSKYLKYYTEVDQQFEEYLTS
ncbi:hypothetical protein SRABI84_04313 [Peribacillus simplex]|uniref:hypothetical protein n=1 Tax=Peribacillus simplex TaxID=1478 RepID=UPI001D8CC79E|nr:hypothetical protein [Peribacillus simplex]CAH0294667.1 hypothetical protein SRABI84_04313 [Peribacillus simplex]